MFFILIFSSAYAAVTGAPVAAPGGGFSGVGAPAQSNGTAGTGTGGTFGGTGQGMPGLYGTPDGTAADSGTGAQMSDGGLFGSEGSAEGLSNFDGAESSVTGDGSAISQGDLSSAAVLTEREINGYFNEILDSGTMGRSTLSTLFARLPRYGMSFFNNTPSTFAPVQSLPVARDYRINVGDQMTLSVWGLPEEGNHSFTIQRDGTARIPRIGTIALAGYTFEEAERIINSHLSKYYVGY
ncbi:MAG: polysaccharide biosynthesis/export family protein, partial [Synergistaceae bacterium]|nr:polysaccharide biosynthesis/export family protein [Synergistaceae bacterium]